MPNIDKVSIESKTITGLQTRTKNSDEMNSDTQKIGALWGRFINTYAPPFPHYGVYSNYASDMHGEFNVLAGIEGKLDGEAIETVTIETGKYLKFSAKGELHQAVMQCWKQIWVYFQDPSIDEKRAYGTDFEVYRSMDEVEVYIGVHYL